jgi:tetratricopeptide (TPR) repeat protein
MSTVDTRRRLQSLTSWGNTHNWIFGAFFGTLSLLATITGFTIWQYVGVPSDKSEQNCATSQTALRFKDCPIIYPNPQGASGVFLDRGIAYKINGNMDRAVLEFTEAIRQNPNNATAYLKRGISYNSMQDYAQSIKDYDQAIKINPGYADAYHYRCNSHRMMHELDLALRDCNRAIELMVEPNALVLGMRGNIYHTKGMIEEALADLNQAIKIDPADANVYSERADVLLGKRTVGKSDIANAFTDIGRAIELEPNNADYYLQRAKLYLSQDQLASAIKDFYLARRRNPESWEASDELCHLNIITNQLDRALADCEAALQFQPHLGNTLNQRAVVHFLMGQTDKAIADFNAALQFSKSEDESGTNPRMKNLAGFAYFGRGKVKIKNGDIAGGNADLALGIARVPQVATFFAVYGIK